MAVTASWPMFHSTLIGREEVAERRWPFSSKPSGWTFKAGQFIDISLLSPPETDAEGDKRGFSIRALLKRRR